MNFGVECVLSAVNEKHHSLIHYVNKHLVKKIKDITSEEAKMHGYANAVLDNSVMLDNDENLIDEEEECINKEFKKIDKLYYKRVCLKRPFLYALIPLEPKKLKFCIDLKVQKMI